MSEVEQPAEAWPIIEHEPEHEPIVPPDLRIVEGLAIIEGPLKVSTLPDPGTQAVRFTVSLPVWFVPAGHSVTIAGVSQCQT